MAVIGVYDHDFFHYQHVIPNLECAKLVTYYRNHHSIATLLPRIEPEKFTKFYIRKEYDDGVYSDSLFLPNVIYGGRAFAPTYAPLDGAIERTIPDMHIYDKYVSYFGTTKKDEETIKRILNCAHIRLSTDSKNLLPRAQITPNFYKVTGIFLHDYDIASIPNSFDFICELQNSRTYVDSDEPRPYPIGNKYPIHVSTCEDLRRWCTIPIIPGAFFIQYDGLLDNETIYSLCTDNKRFARQLYYNITGHCKDENEFLVRRLPEIFPQVLFLRRSGIKILLTYDEGFFITKELKDFVELLNCYICFKWHEGMLPRNQSLYKLCRSFSKLQYTNWAFKKINLTVEQARNVFQYFREHDYALFDKFYQWDAVIYKGGKFISEWEGN